MEGQFKQGISTIQPLIPDLAKERLTEVSTQLDGCAKKWSLEYHAVVAADAGVVIAAHRPTVGDVILKLSPDARGFHAERTALQIFAGRGSVTLLDSAPEYNALLLESVRPGTRLRSVMESGADEENCRIAAAVAARLRAPAIDEHARQLPDAGFEAAETLARYLSLQTPATGPLPPALVVRAASTVSELHASTSELVVLHGDLHHDNILQSDRAGWVAIDPKGRIGDPAYEFSALIRNPIDFLVGHRNLRSLLEQRIELLAAISGYDHAQIAGWAFAMAVVAACWQYEDHEDGWEAWIHVAEALT